MKTNIRLYPRLFAGAFAALLIQSWAARPAPAQEIVTLSSPSPLIEVRVMLKTGSAYDPAGKEGLAALTADALLEAGFGDPERPVTKEDLARITRPWGRRARPSVFVEKEATTFSFVVPRDVLNEYIERVMRPLFTRPLFLEEEVERLANEAITYLTGSLRYENIEMLGLEAVDNYVFEGTPYGHTVTGSVQGLKAITRDDLRSFYATYYDPDRMIVGISTSDRDVVDAIKSALSGAGRLEGRVSKMEQVALRPPPAIQGRELTIVAMPDAGATAIHAAFPISVRRTDDEFWPLYVANVYFGTHRDSHSHLYQQIRRARGYNYGDYSYIEHFAYRPFNLFPPFNTPRSYQYFLIWIRPVGTQYAHHILKAASWELENLIRRGVSDEDVQLSKNKAKVLYLNLAENTSRLLAAKMDDAFYGMEPGYLEGYLQRVEAVTTDQVNAAVRKYLQAEDVKFLIVSEADKAEALAEDIRLDRNAKGKTPADYRIDTVEEGGVTYFKIPENKLEILKLDAVWERHSLRLDPDRVRVVPAEALFETGDFVAKTTATH
jgi:zinc protease